MLLKNTKTTKSYFALGKAYRYQLIGSVYKLCFGLVTHQDLTDNNRLVYRRQLSTKPLSTFNQANLSCMQSKYNKICNETYI